MGKYSLDIQTLSVINGHKLSGIRPDDQGFYTMCIGCIGIPTRAGVFYIPESVLASITNPSAKFAVTIKDGNACGEWGHPDCEKVNEATGKLEVDYARLFKIDENNISHYFSRIWTGDEFQTDKGVATPIMAKVKPMGPKGSFLKEALDDPYFNASFSIRSLCERVDVPGSQFVHKKVLSLVTFDAVHAPGFDITSKRYSQIGAESLDVDLYKLRDAMDRNPGMEAATMLDRELIDGLIARDKEIAKYGRTSFITTDGYKPAASLIYNRR